MTHPCIHLWLIPSRHIYAHITVISHLEGISTHSWYPALLMRHLWTLHTETQITHILIAHSFTDNTHTHCICPPSWNSMPIYGSLTISWHSHALMALSHLYDKPANSWHISILTIRVHPKVRLLYYVYGSNINTYKWQNLDVIELQAQSLAAFYLIFSTQAASAPAPVHRPLGEFPWFCLPVFPVFFDIINSMLLI